MDDRPYCQAFERTRDEDYLEMSGMRLTAAPVQRLSGVDIEICAVVLEDSGSSAISPQGIGRKLRRGGDGNAARSRTTGPQWNANPMSSASRRARDPHATAE